MGLRTAAVLLVAAVCAASCASGPTPSQISQAVVSQPSPSAPPPFWVEAPIVGDDTPVRGHVPATGVVVFPDAVRLLPPPVTSGARRVAIQAGHWKVDEAPAEFPNLRFEPGATVAGVAEVDVTLAVAERVADILRARGITVDVLPATIPPSYVADAFVSIHADDDGEGSATGFKLAHGFYRGPYEDALVDAVTEEYAAATGLPLTDSMTDYYAFAWFRYEHALAPHTPAAIIELGYLSNDEERALLTDRPGVVAAGIANGIWRFLQANPRATLFANAIVVPTVAAPKP
jgi:N-acetylmuramoyl-L-alanine amidase